MFVSRLPTAPIFWAPTQFFFRHFAEKLEKNRHQVAFTRLFRDHNKKDSAAFISQTFCVETFHKTTGSDRHVIL